MHWFALAGLGLLADASIKSLLLAGVAAVLLRVMRIRNAEVSHRVWTAVLVSMLALPWLVHVTPAIPLPVWLLPEFPANQSPKAADGSASLDSQPSIHFGEVPGGEPRPSGDPLMVDDTHASLANGKPAAYASNQALPEGFGPTWLQNEAALVPAVSANTLPIGDSEWLNRIPGNGLTVIAAVYATVTLAFLVRLLLGVLLTWRLVLNSRNIKADKLLTDTMRHRLRKGGDLSRIALLESSGIRVPLTLGFCGPRILLPLYWRSWHTDKLRAVIAHEMAHIRRADYLVNLLAEVNRCVHWFHPLAWFLRGRLAELAEQNCDDAVIASTGDRTQYARHLLEVAGALSASRSRVAWPSAAMARKLSVESRIDAILDTGRPLARRVGSLGVVLLLAIAIPAVLLAAALRPSQADQRPTETESTASVVAGPHDPAAEITSDKESTKEGGSHTTVRGIIFAEGGKLPSGVKLFKSRAHLGKRESDLVELPASSVSSNGSFSVELENFPQNLESGPPGDRWIDFGILAAAPGFGLGWTEHQQVASGKPLVLKLAKDDVPIRGRILDSEGRPVAGARVKIGRIDSVAKGKLDDWLEAIERGESASQIRKHVTRSMSFHTDDLPLAKLGISDDVMTNATGRFEFRGVGRERITTLVVAGPTISRTEFRVATREMSPVTIVANKTGSNPNAIRVYGATTDLVTLPARRIAGAVRDAATGKPLAGVTVRTSQLHGMGGAYYPAFKAITDAEGHYQISGFPRNGDHRILAVPTDDQPFFMREAAVPETAGPGKVEVTIDFELHRGIWIAGRVTDHATGVPVQAALHYLPFLDNEYAAKLPEFSEYGNGSTHFSRHQHRYQTDAEGNYRLVGLPGRAIVGVDAYGAYRIGDGAEKIDGLDEEGEFATYSNPIQAGRSWPTAMKEINPDEGASAVQIDFQLQRGERLQVRIESPEGHPLAEVHIAGLNPSPNVDFEQRSLLSSTVEAIGLAPDEKRTLLIFRRELNHAGIAEIDMRAERGEVLEVRLNTGGSIIGRLLDAQGNPLPAASIEAWTQLGDKGVRLPGVVTDKGGNFLCIGMPAPWKYDLRAEGRTVATGVNIQPGVTLELDDLQIGKTYSGAPKAEAQDTDRAVTPAPDRTSLAD